MPRSIWNGTITLGLIAVPIKVHSATESHTIHFHQVHESDGARIKQKRICSKEGKEVPYKEVAMGYEVRGGEFVMLDQEEIDAAAGDRSHTIELEQFVDPGRGRSGVLQPHLLPGSGRRRRGRLSAAARRAEAGGAVGIGRWVFHNREYLVSVRAGDDLLVLHTMRFADELVRVEKLDIPAPSRKPTERELDMAEQLVESLHKQFRPELVRGHLPRARGRADQAKAKGEEIELPELEDAERAGRPDGGARGQPRRTALAPKARR